MASMKVLLPCLLLAVTWGSVISKNVPSPFQPSSSNTTSIPQVDNSTLPASMPYRRKVNGVHSVSRHGVDVNLSADVAVSYNSTMPTTRIANDNNTTASGNRQAFAVTTTKTASENIPTANINTKSASTNASRASINVTTIRETTTNAAINTTAFTNATTASKINATTIGETTTTTAAINTTASTNATTASTNATTAITTISNITTSTASSNLTTASTPTSITTVPKPEGTTTKSPVPRGGGEPQGCRKVSACVCETENGQRVDLTPLGNTNSTPRFRDLVDPSSAYGYAYSWNPCYSFTEGACQNVAMCQTVPKTTVEYFNLGNQSDVDFEISSDLGFVMRLTGVGTPTAGVPQRITYIRLECDTAVESEFTVGGEPVIGTYYFTLRSRYACLTGSPPTPRSSATPVTTVTPGVVTVTYPGPTSNPVYSLKTVVDLLFVLTLVAVAGLVVLLLVLTVICVRRGMNAGSKDNTKGAIADAHLYPPKYEVHDKKQLLNA